MQPQGSAPQPGLRGKGCPRGVAGLYKNAFYLESAMEALVGRDVEILRSVFSEDIARGMSLEPPEGRSSWKGTITELEDKKFTVSLETCACIEGIFPIDCP